MSNVTAAFAAQDALTGALQALRSTTLAGWTVDFGLPSRRDELHIWVDEQVDEWQQETGVSGRTSHDESFRLNAYVYDRKLDATAKEVRDEVNTAAAIVEEAVMADPTLGGTVSFAAVSGGDYDGAFADSDGRYREGVLHLVVECRVW